jgi:fatty-acyl-CoA synthase
LREGLTVSELELKSFARDALARFKVPTEFELVSALPKTATGKIQKYVLRGKRPGIARQ